MSDFLPFIVIGITTGAVYGLAGVGLVLTYKTSGIFNFAYGAVAALAVFVFYWLHTEHGMPWPYAAALCLFVLSPLEGLVLELVARTLENATATLKVVSTVGILIFMVGLGEIWYGNSNISFPSFLDTNTVRFLGVNIGFDQITVMIISVAATAILYYFFRFVRLGVAMRGVVDNPELVSMTGTNPVVVRRWAWIIGTIFASMAGLLIAPSLNLDAYTIALLVVSAFGAAAIGYFSNLPLVFVGGLFVGVVDALATKYAAAISWLGGLSAGLPFIILFIVLIVMPRARLAERRVVTARAAAPVVVCADTDAAGGGRHRPGLLRLRARLRRHAAGHLVERSGLRHALLVARPADQDLGSDLAVPPGLRRRRSGGVRALRRRLARPVAGGAAPGRAGGHAGGRHHRHPGHPPLGGLLGPGHLRVRDPVRADVLPNRPHVRADHLGHPGPPAGRDHLRLAALQRQGVLLRTARLRGADGRRRAVHLARPHGTPVEGSLRFGRWPSRPTGRRPTS